MNLYQKTLSAHYQSVWKAEPVIRRWEAGPMKKLNESFFVLEFPPHLERKMWTYATNGMFLLNQQRPLELHLFSATQDLSLAELLTATAHYHATGDALDIGHTVNFGRSWQEISSCTYGLLSHPYLDGPELENMSTFPTKCYWLIPITEKERDFKIRFGLEELEERFEADGIDYINPVRPSAI